MEILPHETSAGGRGPASDRLRRNFLIAGRSGEGLLNELIAARQRQGRTSAGSELGLLRDAKRIVDLDAEVANSAFELRVLEEQLHRPQNARLPSICATFVRRIECAP